MPRRSPLLAVVAAALIALASTGTALADVLLGGGVTASSLCVGNTTHGAALAKVMRFSSGPQYPDGATLTFSVGSISQPSNATVVVTSVVDPTIVLPNDWTSQPDSTLSSDTMQYDSTVTATSPGSGVGTITWLVSVNGGPPTPDPHPISVNAIDCTAPTVTINQAAAQADPTGTSPILFDVVFNKPVTGFTAADVVLSGTAGATTATVSGSGPTYQAAVSGMTANGTVIATIPAGAALGDGSTPNDASTSTDNTVTFAVATPPTPTPTIPTVAPTKPTGPPSDTAQPAETTDQGSAMPLVLLALASISLTLLVVPRRRPR